MHKLKKFLVIGLGLAIMTLAVPAGQALAATTAVSSMPTLVVADAVSSSQSAACSGATLGASSTCPDGTSSLGGLVKSIIKWLSIGVGVAAVIMLIIGGLKYVTSGGESSKVASAKNTILFALIGVAIAAMAQTLVHFVLANVK